MTDGTWEEELPLWRNTRRWVYTKNKTKYTLELPAIPEQYTKMVMTWRGVDYVVESVEEAKTLIQTFVDLGEVP